jgi:hypothetical protein
VNANYGGRGVIRKDYKNIQSFSAEFVTLSTYFLKVEAKYEEKLKALVSKVIESKGFFYEVLWVRD